MTNKKRIKAKLPILIELLLSFSNNEIEQFSLFLESPYHNTDQRAIKLFTVLKPIVLNKRPFDNATQVNIYQAVFENIVIPTANLDEKQYDILRAKMSILTKLAQQFLTLETLKENSKNESELLHKKLLEKKQLNLLHRHLKKEEKKLAKQATKDLEHYAFALQVDKDKMDYLYQKGILLAQDNFSSLIHHLDLHYIINKLKVQSTMLSVKLINPNKSYDFEAMSAIERLLALPQYANNPLVMLYQTIIQFMGSYDEENYFRLLELLNQSDDTISKKDWIDFYHVALNFCILQVRAGKIAYNINVFELYREMDKKDLLMGEGFIELFKLKNIIASSCHVGEFDWAREIVHKYTPSLAKKISKSVYHLYLGAIEFYQSNYKQAISHLIRVEKIDLVHDVDCRMLLLKSYYQMDTTYDQRTIQIFRTAEKFVQSIKTTSTAYKKSYKNFIQILINLYRVRHRVGKRTLVGVQNKLAKMDFVSDKKWLLEKIAEL